MDTFLINQNNELQYDGFIDRPLKLTSLIYLEEALRGEAYEQCAEILSAAREIGVDSVDIKRVIQDHVAYLKQQSRKVTARW